VEDLTPEEPSEAGVEEQVADSAHEEGARLLADEALPRLAAAGFSDDQIRRWAEVFVARQGSGDPEEFIAWIAQQEHQA
jgi:hypothetical protein